MSSRSSDLYKLLETFQCGYYDAVYVSSGSCLEVKIQQLCSSATHKQNDSIALPLSDYVQCWERLLFSRMAGIFQPWNI